MAVTGLQQDPQVTTTSSSPLLLLSRDQQPSLLAKLASYTIATLYTTGVQTLHTTLAKVNVDELQPMCSYHVLFVG